MYRILREIALSLILDSLRVLKSDLSLGSFPERETFGLHPVHVVVKGRILPHSNSQALFLLI